MNQIINTDLNKHSDMSNSASQNKQDYSKKKFFNIQFILSIFSILIIITIFIYYKILLNNKERFSNLLINNYSITKLYSNNNIILREKENLQPNSIIGIIEIPVLNISYPIFNSLTDELLKTSPCKFYGNFPYVSNDVNSFNFCIAGHNYDNNKFFSKIKNLKINDKIFLYDNFDNKYCYSVIKNYEVKSNDLSPVYDTITNYYELTLVTCNNFNDNRIIIKAKIEDE